jgi:hypothetical protein
MLNFIFQIAITWDMFSTFHDEFAFQISLNEIIANKLVQTQQTLHLGRQIFHINFEILYRLDPGHHDSHETFHCWNGSFPSQKIIQLHNPCLLLENGFTLQTLKSIKNVMGWDASWQKLFVLVQVLPHQVCGCPLKIAETEVSALFRHFVKSVIFV